MSKNRYELLDEMLEHMCADKLLQELVDAMSDAEATENFEFICRMWDLPVFDEGEEDDEEGGEDD
jgi:hypothetical protein